MCLCIEAADSESLDNTYCIIHTKYDIKTNMNNKEMLMYRLKWSNISQIGIYVIFQVIMLLRTYFIKLIHCNFF